MINDSISKLFEKLAIFLEMEGIPFKPQAYRKASLIIETLEQNLKEIYEKEKKEGLMKIPGIGEGIAEKIEEFIKTGKIKELEKYKQKYPVEVEELMKVEGVGPKTIKTLYDKLKIKNLNDLEKGSQRK